MKNAKQNTDQKSIPNEDILTLIEDSAKSMIFATRKEWRELPEMRFGELIHFETMLIFTSDAHIYMLLHNTSPFDYLRESCNAFRLVRISIDEESKKQKFYTMNLSRAEAAQLIKCEMNICDAEAEDTEESETVNAEAEDTEESETVNAEAEDTEDD